MISRLLLATLLPITLNACSSKYLITPTQEENFNYAVEGMYHIQSNPNTGVAVGAPINYDNSGDLLFFIGATNSTKKSIVFGPSNIYILIDEKPANIMEVNDIVSRELTSIRKRRDALIISGAINAANASSNAYTQEEGQISGNVNGQNFNAQYQGQTYNPALATQLRNESLSITNSQFNQLEAEAQNIIKLIHENMLTKSDLGPGLTSNGLVLIEKGALNKESGMIFVNVFVGGIKHTYSFSYQKKI